MTRDDDHDRDSVGNRWVAYELHDGLLQWVVAARMELDAVLHELQDQPRAAATIQAALLHIERALQEGRELIRFFEGSQTAGVQSLASAVAGYADALESTLGRSQQTVRVEIEPIAELPERVQWNLLRIVQQAIRNATLHAGPATITVRGRQVGELLRLEVADDGGGFDPQKVDRTRHFGLASMQHRASSIGARLDLHAQPGAGCRIVCEYPLARSPS